MSFRWHKGRLSASLSRCGPRAGYRLGCALPIPVVVGIVLTLMSACGIGLMEEPTATPAHTDCSLPWSTMDQVFACGSPRYEVASTEGEQIVHIIVPSKDAQAIAAAMAHAWNEYIPADLEAVVWVYSDASLVGTGYDRGVLSEQGMLGEELVFEICTSWEEFEGIGEICGERMDFTVVQD